MAVSSVFVKSVSANQDGFTGERSYSVVYGVKTTDPEDGPVIVGTASYGGISIPAKFSYFICGNDFDFGSWCKSLKETRVASQYWEVVADYTNKWPEQTDPDHPPLANPLLRPAKINWTTTEIEELMTEDLDSVAPKNTAGDPLEGGLTRIITIHICNLTRNEASYTPAYSDEFSNKMNSSTFAGLGQDKVLCKAITGAGPEKEDDFLFSIVNYELHFRTTGTWREKILNQGFRTKNGSTIENIKDDKGNDITAPVCLNQAGTAKTTTPHFLTFRTFDRVNFAGMNLPSLIIPG